MFVDDSCPSPTHLRRSSRPAPGGFHLQLRQTRVIPEKALSRRAIVGTVRLDLRHSDGSAVARLGLSRPRSTCPRYGTSRARPTRPTTFILSTSTSHASRIFIPAACQLDLAIAKGLPLAGGTPGIPVSAASEWNSLGYSQNELAIVHKSCNLHTSLSATGESCTLTLAVLSVGRGIGPDG